MHYYDLHPFTEAQAQHAAATVLDLIRYKRFFLHNAGEWHVYRDEDYLLHPDVFAEAIALNEAHVAAHRTAREKAQDEIEQFEADHGIVMAKPPKGKSVVEFGRYGGGFEICRVYPLAAFAAFVPKDIDTIMLQLLQIRLGDQTKDDIAPKLHRAYAKEALDLAKDIWEQLQRLDASNPENNRCLILMQSRTRLDERDRKGDFAEGKLWDMQDFALATGFLLFRYSIQRRIVHGNVISSTNYRSHVRLTHISDGDGIAGKLSINFDTKGGYTDKTLFATIL